MYRKLLPQLEPVQRAPSPNTIDDDMSDSTGSTMSIPASKPPSEDEPDPFSRKKGRSIPPLDNFLSTDSEPVDAFVHSHKVTASEKTASIIRETQRRFARGTPEHGGNHCTALDRRTVLDIYAQALDKLSSAPEKHIQIAAECTRKVRVVLSIIAADPDDTVFLTSGQLLSPLEPQYANPRIDRGDDQFGYRAQWRLNAWRQEGWPEKYPERAIEREAKNQGEGLVGRGKMSDATLRKKVLTTNDLWEDGDKILESMNGNSTRNNEKRKEVDGEGLRAARVQTTISGPYTPTNADHDSDLEDADDDWS